MFATLYSLLLLLTANAATDKICLFFTIRFERQREKVRRERPFTVCVVKSSSRQAGLNAKTLLSCLVRQRFIYTSSGASGLGESRRSPFSGLRWA